MAGGERGFTLQPLGERVDVQVGRPRESAVFKGSKQIPDRVLEKRVPREVRTVHHAEVRLHERRGKSGCGKSVRQPQPHIGVRALEWASHAEIALGFHLVGAVWRFWWLHGYRTEGLDWIARFLRLRSVAPAGISEASYAKVLRANVVLLSAMGSFDEARGPCEEAIALQPRSATMRALRPR